MLNPPHVFTNIRLTSEKHIKLYSIFYIVRILHIYNEVAHIAKTKVRIKRNIIRLVAKFPRMLYLLNKIEFQKVIFKSIIRH